MILMIFFNQTGFRRAARSLAIQIRQLDFDQAVTERQCDGMRPVGSAELADNRLYMRIDRSLCNVQNLSHLPGRFSVGNPTKNLDFPSRQIGLTCRSSTQDLISQSCVEQVCLTSLGETISYSSTIVIEKCHMANTFR